MAHRTLFWSLASACLAFASPALGGVGAVDHVVPAKVQVIKEDAKSGYEAKVAKIVAKPLVKGETFPLPITDPTLAGASLRFFKILAPAGSPDVVLPAAGWQGLGKPAGSKGWKYKGAGSGSDPCKVVLVKPKVIKAVCKGPEAFEAPSPYSLPIGFDDAAAWQLVIGGDRYCAQSSNADSTVKKDDGTKGVFKAVSTSPNGNQTCPGCDHSPCVEGNALLASCSSCAATICGEDSFCCRVAWDSACAESASSCAECIP